MLLRDEREALCAHARRMKAEGLAEGTSGNLSIRAGALVAVTPSNLPYERLDAEAVCVVDLAGRRVEGSEAPSSELPMHLAVYRATGAAAVVHTHSVWATAVSMVADELPVAHYMLAFVGGAVRVAPYATPGTEELGERLLAALGDRSAALLQNHGAVTIGPSLERAWWYATIIEWTASVWSRAKLLGDPR
ncbi:MAG: class II aldolase/adducin family protein, partial [Nocardioidaceae bacterium]